MPSTVPIWAWVLFHAVIFSLLALDLGVINRKSHVVSVREALGWSAFWIGLSMAFCVGIWVWMGGHKAVEFLTGYVVEYALSVDNIFVFLLVFGYFKVRAEHQHKVLFWGIIGAFVMRAAMIFAGTALIHRFEWIIYIFGVFLIYTGIKLAFGRENEVEPAKNPAIKLLRRVMPVSPKYDGAKFFTQLDGKRAATPLFVVLLVIETTDLLFAVDSIPAILAITHDQFIVYTSNICAILGLRSLYFALAGVMDLFHFLKYGLSFVLSFVGLKMLLSHTPLKIPTPVSLVIIIMALTISILISVWHPDPKNTAAEDLAEDAVYPDAIEPDSETTA